MRKAIHTILTWLGALGFEPLKTVSALKNLPVTLREHFELRQQNSLSDDPWIIELRSPSFTDRKDPGGVASGHYFHQDMLVARQIFERKPQKHVDIGSRIDGFVAHVATFREVEVFDIRPISSKVKNLVFHQVDIMKPDQSLRDYSDSISCLHALEHFGLGRYGDPIDSEGYKKGLSNISEMLRSNGILYLSMPMGTERIDFNGQRVFSLKRIVELYSSDFSLLRFSYIDDKGDLHEDVEIKDGFDQSYGLVNGCGIFELQKL